MNIFLDRLPVYPFTMFYNWQKMLVAPSHLPIIDLSKGVPRQKIPDFFAKELQDNISRMNAYPSLRGNADLLQAASSWLMRRFQLPLYPYEKNILITAGSREALRVVPQAFISPTDSDAVIVVMNPAYPIYVGGAILAGARVEYLNLQAPDFKLNLNELSPEVWEKVRMIYICTPHNPTGISLGLDEWKLLFEYASRYQFIILSDECYTDLYNRDAPIGSLQAAYQLGYVNFDRVLAFFSLSKRSNVCGARSGFVTGEQSLIDILWKYRDYHGAGVPIAIQKASVLAWEDEAHVAVNRSFYQKRFALAETILSPVLPFIIPSGGIFLWLSVPIDDKEFARVLYEEDAVSVVPGSFLGCDTANGNPGKRFIRVALIEEDEVVLTRALRYIATLLQRYY